MTETLSPAAIAAALTDGIEIAYYFWMDTDLTAPERSRRHVPPHPVR